MRQPKRRAALLLTGATAVSLALTGLAARPASAQNPIYNSPFANPGMPVGGGAMPMGGGLAPRGFPSAPIGSGQSSGSFMRPAYPTGPFMGTGMSANSYGGQNYRNFSAPSAPILSPAMPQAGYRLYNPRPSTDRERPIGSATSTFEEPHSLGIVPSGRVQEPMRPTSARNLTGVVTIPTAPTTIDPPRRHHPVRGDGDFYPGGTTVIVTNGPALLGGYYYGNYCDTYYGAGTFPAVYSAYQGFPAYIYSISPSVSVLGYAPPVYVTDPQSFSPPQYTVTYNQNNYYVADETQAEKIEGGGADAPAALKHAYPAGSYQAAFADIERAWTQGDVSLLKKHFRSDDTKISVSLRGKYKYSLNASDFAQITRDAFDRLNTVSFKFTALQKAKNGDVTAYGTHVYRTSGAASKGGDSELVPFDSDAPPSEGPDTNSAGQEKTVYISYTVRHGDDGWYIVGLDSSPDPLVKQDK